MPKYHRCAAAKARDEWLDSAEGQKCLAGNPYGVYLKNRLELAFLAGWSASIPKSALERFFSKMRTVGKVR